MYQKISISLFDLLGDSTAFGNIEGREVFQKLKAKVDLNSENSIIEISLTGIKRTDASFPRESVMSLVKLKNGEKCFFLSGFESRDLIDNWDYAAKAKEQTLIVLTSDGYELIGKSISDNSKELLDFIIKSGSTTTSNIAKKFDVTSQNASAKLKRLMSVGLVLSSKQVAETGGIEFVHSSII